MHINTKKNKKKHINVSFSAVHEINQIFRLASPPAQLQNGRQGWHLAADLNVDSVRTGRRPTSRHHCLHRPPPGGVDRSPPRPPPEVYNRHSWPGARPGSGCTGPRTRDKTAQLCSGLCTFSAALWCKFHGAFWHTFGSGTFCTFAYQFDCKCETSRL